MNNAILIKWLKLVAIFHVLGGIALATDFPSVVWEVYRQELFSIFNMTTNSNAEFQSLLTMIVRLFGATVASWGAIMWIVIQAIEDHGVTKYRLPLVFALLIWFVIDCTISVSHGVYIHLLVNITALMSILVPLVLLKSEN